jgi:predicted nucleotidyltransferase
MYREVPIPSRSADDPVRMREMLTPLFAATPGIVCAHLFGSRATGEHGPLSDIDIAYHSDRRMPMMDEARLLYALGIALGTHEVDLVSLRAMSLRTRVNVLEEGILLYARTREEVADLLARLRQEYFDFRVYEREYDREFLRNLRAKHA